MTTLGSSRNFAAAAFWTLLVALVPIAATSVAGRTDVADARRLDQTGETARPDDQERGERKEFADIAALLTLSAGKTVADIGAGGGNWTRRLSSTVGPEGRVFATEIRDHLLEGLLVLARKPPLENVTVVTSGTASTNLPDGCCDAVLLRLVYHAFKEREHMRASLHRAVKPNGRVLIIDFEPTPERLSRDMETTGFQRRALIPRWQGQESVYAAVFEMVND